MSAHDTQIFMNQPAPSLSERGNIVAMEGFRQMELPVLLVEKSCSFLLKKKNGMSQDDFLENRKRNGTYKNIFIVVQKISIGAL